MADFVADELRSRGRCIVVVSEGFDVSAAGDLGATHDAFGHIEYGASRATVAQQVVNYLNNAGLPVRGNAVGQVPGVLQRSTSVFASSVDRHEAYRVGTHAVSLAQGGDSGVMAALQRRGGGLVADAPYELQLGSVPVAEVANFHRHMPREWIDPNRPDVTDAFVRYARPLIGEDWPGMEVEAGLQRFARFDRHRVTPLLPKYLPQNHR
jgi:6-phosphofructokinase 1